MTLPLAHVGHYLWILYLLPVIFVIAGILKTTLAERHRKEDAPPGDDAGEGGSDDD
jgi:cytochrome c-type biogenesis protein CcmH/NrfF